MFKKYRILKWAGLLLLTFIILVVSFGFWFMGLIPPKDTTIEAASVENLPYLSENIIPNRGKILAVVTSTDVMGSSDKSTGYELTELARAYYVFEANGYEVDIASPKGGRPPVVIDDEDMGAFDYAFLNDTTALYKSKHTIPIAEIDPQDYEAVYFVGGKGAMWDFPNNTAIQDIVKNYYQSNKVIGAVCHGPSALVNVVLDNGRPLLEHKNVSSFTNEEELLLISDARSIFPFLLEDKITERGAKFNEGAMYLEQISHDDNLITGQNPWSTWSLAESMIKQLGHTPKERVITDEENAVKVIAMYHHKGKAAAKKMIHDMSKDNHNAVNRVLIAKHSIIAGMRGHMGDFFNMVGLVSYTKKCATASGKI